MDTETKLDLDDIQGIVLHGYDRLPFTRYLFVQFQTGTANNVDEARAHRVRRWIADIAGQVTSCGPHATPPTDATHLAFTARGLYALGFVESEMSTFSRPFQMGMTDEYRQRILGDLDDNDPARWNFGGPTNPEIHALLVIYADTADRLDRMTIAQREAMKAAKHIKEIHVEEGYRPPDGKEHFGFYDGISQPIIEGSGRKPDDGEPPIKAGEFVLGYRNEYDERPASPSVPAGFDPNGYLFADPVDSGRRDLGRNGTFLVLRKLKQDVGAFWRFVVEGSNKPGRAADPNAATHLAARIVGRWPSGASLVVSPERDDETKAAINDFGYSAQDPSGMRCPIGSHVRRANPRDALPPDAAESKKEARRHRILRRGRIYGPRVEDLYAGVDDGIDRGLQFVVINANIYRQFEFVQQTWVNSPKFGNLNSDPDPLVGVHPHERDKNATTGRDFTIQQSPLRSRFIDLPHFVKVRGGAYFFLPGIRGLRYIAAGGYAGPNRSASPDAIMM